jgi:S-DNA-T family DNA segregation ATPase FtsK/SpoIIIE
MTFAYGQPQENWLGLLGYAVGWMLSYLFGLLSFGIVGFFGWVALRLLIGRPPWQGQILYFFVFITSLAFLLNLSAEIGLKLPEALSKKVISESISFENSYPHNYFRYNFGGIPCYFLYRDLPLFNLQELLSNTGIGITFGLMAILSFILMTKFRVYQSIEWCCQKFQALKSLPLQDSTLPAQPEESAPSRKESIDIEETLLAHIQPVYSPTTLLREKLKAAPIATPTISTTRPEPSLTFSSNRQIDPGYQLPPLSLLNDPKKTDQPALRRDLRKQADILEETLLSFGIEAKVGEIHCGPTITSFEVHPAVGVKVQKITALENDIALNLQATAVRVIAPIPGKAAVGIEIPSLNPQGVSFKELLIAYQNQAGKMYIPVLLGKAVAGENVILDLAKMPHLIIAGATGSGKSVCINTLIMSILMTATPDEIRLLMIDPKKVELTSYTELPHLVAPVITEADDAYAALQWLVQTMQMRYELLKQLGLRNLEAFNNRSIDREFEETLPQHPIPEKLPAIVAIIDEFADLMMVSSQDIETPIARIAQMARAVGIHLVLATQRPSREVITGSIKANIPTRIAFKVASRVNSQIILDDNGAQCLLGNGDMLLLGPGSSHLHRAQGAYISDEEIQKVVNFISLKTPPSYLIPSFKSSIDMQKIGGASRDMLFEQAKSIVLDMQSASTTFLQRKLKIGYARAASLMDELESAGIISPQEGAKPRRVLIKNAYANTEDISEDEAESET